MDQSKIQDNDKIFVAVRIRNLLSSPTEQMCASVVENTVLLHDPRSLPQNVPDSTSATNQRDTSWAEQQPFLSRTTNHCSSFTFDRVILSMNQDATLQMPLFRYPQLAHSSFLNDPTNPQLKTTSVPSNRLPVPLVGSQLDVYECTAIHSVQAAMEGVNSCVFAYGQTGTGKSYTLFGEPEDAGIVPRTIRDLFNNLELRQKYGMVYHGPTAALEDEVVPQPPASEPQDEYSFQVQLAFLEIYQKEVTCLISRRNGLSVRERPNSAAPFVEGLEIRTVVDAREGLELIERGLRRRKVGETSLNSRSSRSHAIVQVFVKQWITAAVGAEKQRQVSSNVTPLRTSLSCTALSTPTTHPFTHSETIELSSLINLVDLAGSERQKLCKYDVSNSSAAKEGMSINLSLHHLSKVINECARRCKYVSYRDSKLTLLLKDNLGGNSKTFMIATISPSSSCYQETVATLQYAKNVSQIHNNPSSNRRLQVKVDLQQENAALRLQIERMQMERTAAVNTPIARTTTREKVTSLSFLDCTDTMAFETAQVTPHLDGVRGPLLLVTSCTGSATSSVSHSAYFLSSTLQQDEVEKPREACARRGHLEIGGTLLFEVLEMFPGSGECRVWLRPSDTFHFSRSVTLLVNDLPINYTARLSHGDVITMVDNDDGCHSGADDSENVSAGKSFSTKTMNKNVKAQIQSGTGTLVVHFLDTSLTAKPPAIDSKKRDAPSDLLKQMTRKSPSVALQELSPNLFRALVNEFSCPQASRKSVESNSSGDRSTLETSTKQEEKMLQCPKEEDDTDAKSPSIHNRSQVFQDHRENAGYPCSPKPQEEYQQQHHKKSASMSCPQRKSTSNRNLHAPREHSPVFRDGVVPTSDQGHGRRRRSISSPPLSSQQVAVCVLVRSNTPTPECSSHIPQEKQLCAQPLDGYSSAMSGSNPKMVASVLQNIEGVLLAAEAGRTNNIPNATNVLVTCSLLQCSFGEHEEELKYLITVALKVLMEQLKVEIVVLNKRTLKRAQLLLPLLAKSPEVVFSQSYGELRSLLTDAMMGVSNKKGRGTGEVINHVGSLWNINEEHVTMIAAMKDRHRHGCRIYTSLFSLIQWYDHQCHSNINFFCSNGTAVVGEGESPQLNGQQLFLVSILELVRNSRWVVQLARCARKHEDADHAASMLLLADLGIAKKSDVVASLKGKKDVEIVSQKIPSVVVETNDDVQQSIIHRARKVFKVFNRKFNIFSSTKTIRNNVLPAVGEMEVNSQAENNVDVASSCTTIHVSPRTSTSNYKTPPETIQPLKEQEEEVKKNVVVSAALFVHSPSPRLHLPLLTTTSESGAIPTLVVERATPPSQAGSESRQARQRTPLRTAKRLASLTKQRQKATQQPDSLQQDANHFQSQNVNKDVQETTTRNQCSNTTSSPTAPILSPMVIALQQSTNENIPSTRSNKQTECEGRMVNKQEQEEKDVCCGAPERFERSYVSPTTMTQMLLMRTLSTFGATTLQRKGPSSSRDAIDQQQGHPNDMSSATITTTPVMTLLVKKKVTEETPHHVTEAKESAHLETITGSRPTPLSFSSSHHISPLPLAHLHPSMSQQINKEDEEGSPTTRTPIKPKFIDKDEESIAIPTNTSRTRVELLSSVTSTHVASSMSKTVRSIPNKVPQRGVGISSISTPKKATTKTMRLPESKQQMSLARPTAFLSENTLILLKKR